MNDKDQAAIDHVASVSKHPHAAMIVKWLITGWDVEFQHAVGKWKISDYPTWSPVSKYRFIEPKPSKPAYRVYADRDGDLFVAERNSEGVIYQTFTEGCEWLSEWIEYDQPKKWPTPLVQRIAAIDLDAAQWIVEHWDDLLDERYSEGVTAGRESGRLCSMFTWSSSTQGKEYWYAISKQLGES